MSEWEFDDPFAASGAGSGAADVAQAIDGILSGKDEYAGDAVPLADVDAAFAAIGEELATGEEQHMFSKQRFEKVDDDFDSVSATMDAIEVQDVLLDDFKDDAERIRLEKVYRDNLTKLTAAVEQMGSATEQMRAFDGSDAARAAALAAAGGGDAQQQQNGISDALASVQKLLNETKTVQSHAPLPKSTFTTGENLSAEKLTRLKRSLTAGFQFLEDAYANVKAEVNATNDLSLAVALTAPIAVVRQDFMLLAKLVGQPQALPKLELSMVAQYKVSVARLILAMKRTLDAAKSTVEQATSANSLTVVRIARIISTAKKAIEEGGKGSCQ